ncbi:MAG: 2-dehydro-3-deoxygalactonokinase [Paracoccaceae bacterium]|jgi:2-dehydro-3-deoxygalactonokinase|nr:2-dehydro-3-deoxygalactonokinase [Paracoccaceae bacterium]MDG2451523.1 2-dehydro-3-deoxygalactonokinase [Paracoccaceae bacterium]
MDANIITADWVAVDWGTSNMRAWCMSASGTERAAAASKNGMGVLAPDQFEDALLEVIGPWMTDRVLTVLCCGMVGSRQGWVEAPYATVPCPVCPEGLVSAPTKSDLLDVRVIPGIKQNTPSDVMRGEETQIAGFLALNENWDGVICLPGTHTKWVQVSAGEIVSFQTFMTGELFSVISDKTVLRHTISPVGWDNDAYLAAVDDAMAKPERLAARLFSLRAEDLLTDLAGTAARSRLSGLLVGAELAAARPYWLGQNVAIIGAGEISRLYGQALSAQGVPATLADGSRFVLAGLNRAYSQLNAAS